MVPLAAPLDDNSGLFIGDNGYLCSSLWLLKAFCLFNSEPHVTALLHRIQSILQRPLQWISPSPSVTIFGRLQSTIRLDNKTVKSLSSNNAARHLTYQMPIFIHGKHLHNCKVKIVNISGASYMWCSVFCMCLNLVTVRLGKAGCVRSFDLQISQVYRLHGHKVGTRTQRH